MFKQSVVLQTRYSLLQYIVMDSRLTTLFTILVIGASSGFAAPPLMSTAALLETNDSNSSAFIKVLNELKKLGRLSENDEAVPDNLQGIESIRLVEDPDEIETILSKDISENGDVIEDFQPITLPSDFSMYDIDRDGVISRDELLKVTGARENMDIVFNASDLNDDNMLDELEFNLAPWNLNGDLQTSMNITHFTDIDDVGADVRNGEHREEDGNGKADEIQEGEYYHDETFIEEKFEQNVEDGSNNLYEYADSEQNISKETSSIKNAFG